MTDRGDESHQEALIDGYVHLLTRSRHMLQAARDADWPTLIGQESQYAMQIEKLAKHDTGVDLDAAHRTRKAELLEKILENDLEIRERLIERRDELSKLMGASRRQQTLSRAYGVEGQEASQPSHLRLSKRVP